MDYKAILLAAGYYETKGCSCGGVRNEKFKKGRLTVYVRPTKQKFRIKNVNYFTTEYKPLNELAEALASQAIGV